MEIAGYELIDIPDWLAEAKRTNRLGEEVVSPMPPGHEAHLRRPGHYFWAWIAYPNNGVTQPIPIKLTVTHEPRDNKVRMTLRESVRLPNGGGIRAGIAVEIERRFIGPLV